MRKSKSDIKSLIPKNKQDVERYIVDHSVKLNKTNLWLKCLQKVTMSKRNIAYIKPQDPKFLQALKHQIGYKEGPTVETKRQKLEDLDVDTSNADGREREDERPQIVVINSGDLTAEEVTIEEKRLAKEVAEARADLSQPIVFAKPQKTVKRNKEKQTKSRGNSKLSFSIEEEEVNQ